jgi:hypothetical protein
MARQNVPLLAFQRGIISPKSLARVDLDRTRLSAETMTNWLPKTQGPMTLRPGTKFIGSSFNDSGAEFLEFIASADDLALLELTNDTGSGLGTMRSWQGSDAHDLSLLGRPAVDTTVALTDTGWVNGSTGGVISFGDGTDVIPTMTGPSTAGVTITASSEVTSSVEEDFGPAWFAADDSNSTEWKDTGNAGGPGGNALPSWWNADFDTGANTVDRKAITSYSIRAVDFAGGLDNAPTAWRLITGNFDTGTFATDTGKWTLEDERSGQTGWATSERRSFTLPGADTGTVEARRHWRLFFTAVDGDTELNIAEIEMFTAVSAVQTQIQGGSLVLNASSIGARAKYQKRVIVSDTGTEHSLAIHVSRGPVTLRVGSTAGDDDYISEASLGTGYHNLAFTPTTDFHVTVQSDALIDRIVNSLSIGDSGTVEVRTPWTGNDLDNVRYDQSADVLFANCNGVRPQKIERRGTGRSWSVVDYAPDDGPFLSSPSSSAKLSVSHFYGNTKLNSDIPVFRSGHVGSLVRLFHEGQGGEWALGALDAKTDPIEVTGIGDTGTPNASNERRITVSVTGAYAGRIAIERSFDGPDFGFKPITQNIGQTQLDTGDTAGTDTGTFSANLDDTQDNISVHYRARMMEYTSGAALVEFTYAGGSVTGRARITGYNSNTDVDIEVLSRFSDTGMTDNWQFGHWSEARGFPTANRLHGGRLAHAQGGSIFLSASDDFENFDVSVEGDAAPIIRTIGSGPVDNIHFLMSVLRLLVGTAGSELTVKSSSLDEPLTPSNSSIVPFSTQGSANVRAVALDTRAIMVQRSKQRVFELGPAQNTLADYEAFELTLLVPDLLAAGVVSIAVQRQPDTRIHCVLGDGRVGILTYEPNEEVIAWSIFESDTGTSPLVERAMVLPGIEEDAVYYHIRRTINGSHKRYLEKWALESECLGDTGLSYLMDCAVIFGTGSSQALTFADAAEHLGGESVVAWGDLDSGSTPFVDLSPGIGSLQTRYTLDTGGDLTLSGLTDGVSQGVLGLPYKATWKSSKLAYAAEMGSALGQVKRVPQASLILYKTHQSGIQFGAKDTGELDSLSGRIDGKVIDVDTIHETLDQVAVPVPGTYETDPRLILRAASPRPATVLAVVPTVGTNEK